MSDWKNPLEDWVLIVHANARQKGFWDDAQDIRDEAGEIDTVSVLSKIALIHSEIVEAYDDWKLGRTEMWFVPETDKPEGLPIELADVAIRILDTMGGLGIDPALVAPKSVIYTQGAEALFLDMHCQLAYVTEQARSGYEGWLLHAGYHLTTVINICRELCTRCSGKPIEEMMKLKHAYNTTRAYKHGKKA